MASMVFKFRVLCLITLLPLGSLAFTCPGAIYPSGGLWYASIEPNISARASHEYQKIRIKPIYHSTIERKYKELVQKGADFWSNILSVKPVSGRLFFAPYCKSEKDIVFIGSKETGVKERHCLGSCTTDWQCHGYTVPKEHRDGCKSCKEDGSNCYKNDTTKGTGVEDADLVFYVTAENTENCLDGQTVAYAAPCEFDPDLFRPLFALINICPDAVRKHDHEKNLIVIKHEMMHALGFGFHQIFRGKDSKPLWPSYENGIPKMDKDVKPEKVLKTIERDWHVRGQRIKRNLTFLVTPKVVKEARAHFNCPDLEGAELEDSGGNGSRHAHFEARVFYDDAMKANVDSGKGLFTRLDFAVLEDSGWYQVEYNQAENMDFGQNLGCDFCMKSCKFWMDEKRKKGESLEPYCDSPDLMYRRGFACFGTKKLFSGCPLIKYESNQVAKYHDAMSFELFDELPKKYQNFDNINGVYDSNVGRCGSFDPAADFCPVPVEKFAIEEKDDPECEVQNNDEEKDPMEDEEDELRNQASHLSSSVQLVSFLTLIDVMLLRVGF